jgi:hypothetical protein
MFSARRCSDPGNGSEYRRGAATALAATEYLLLSKRTRHQHRQKAGGK